jgi:hypothetical protein
MSLEFPTLDNGLVAQLPIELRISKNIIHNQFRDRSVLANSTSARTKYSWSWTYSNISDAEMSRILYFWEQTGRGAKAIRFYDPLGNLLRHSEELATENWQRVGPIDVTELDPVDGIRQYLLTNSGDTDAEIAQTVNVESLVSLVLSVRAKWAGAVNVVLASTAEGSEVNQNYSIDGSRVCELAIQSGIQGSIRRVSIRVPAHTQVIISEPQLEIGLRRGDYLMSNEGGIFESAWIDPNQFRLWSTAPGSHSIFMNVLSFR